MARLSLTPTRMRASLILPVLLLSFAVRGQSGTGTQEGRIEILNADRGEFDAQIAPGAQRLKGNVRFRHRDAIMSCDMETVVEEGGAKYFMAGNTKLNKNKRRFNGNTRLRKKLNYPVSPTIWYLRF